LSREADAEQVSGGPAGREHLSPARVRKLGQRALSGAKKRTGAGFVRLRQHENPRVAAATKKTEETVSKGVDLANRSTQTVLNAAQSQLGLDDLVATLTENLEASLLVIASQQDRIEHLEMRLERRVRDTRRSTDVDDQQVTAIDHAIQRRT